MIATDCALPDELLDASAFDQDGHARTLRDAIAKRAALVVFLRHFGCTGCSQQVDALIPHVAQLSQLGLTIVLIGSGQQQHLAGFIERHKLAGYPLEMLTDPSLTMFRAAGLQRSLWRTLGPTALAKEVVARTRGYFSTNLEGDVFQQGGVLLCDPRGTVVFSREHRYASEPIAATVIVKAALRLVAQTKTAALEVAS